MVFSSILELVESMVALRLRQFDQIKNRLLLISMLQVFTPLLQLRMRFFQSTLGEGFATSTLA
jgi:ABC-type bacteriocin/lantibiotic exporter with double-glycine peptidase domain